jgi:chromate transporter
LAITQVDKMEAGQDASDHKETGRPSHVSCLDLLLGFLTVGMIGFGGIANALFHVVVEKRQWLTAEEYTMTFGLAQILPGAAPINTSIMIADRFQGFRGVVCAIGGLLCVPLTSLIVLAMVYDHFSDLPEVRYGTIASVAAAAGLSLGTALKASFRVLHDVPKIILAVASFAAIGIFRVPMIPAMIALMIAAFAFDYLGREK